MRFIIIIIANRLCPLYPGEYYLSLELDIFKGIGPLLGLFIDQQLLFIVGSLVFSSLDGDALTALVSLVSFALTWLGSKKIV